MSAAPRLFGRGPERRGAAQAGSAAPLRLQAGRRGCWRRVGALPLPTRLACVAFLSPCQGERAGGVRALLHQARVWQQLQGAPPSAPAAEARALLLLRKRGRWRRRPPRAHTLRARPTSASFFSRAPPAARRATRRSPRSGPAPATRGGRAASGTCARSTTDSRASRWVRLRVAARASMGLARRATRRLSAASHSPPALLPRLPPRCPAAQSVVKKVAKEVEPASKDM